MAERSLFDGSGRTSLRIPVVGQAFSDDGGKSWEINWINTYTRVKGEPHQAR